MRFLVFLVLLSGMAFCFADEVDEIIQPLGLSKEDLKDLWYAGRCEPSWSVPVDPEVLKDKDLLGYKGLKAGFFESEYSDNKAVLTAGPKCDALNKYYFEGDSNTEIIEFIALDKEFAKKYGHSVLDAIYIEGVQFYSWNGDVSDFHLKYAKKLAQKGLFTLKQERSEFNGKPSVSFSGERTGSGDRLHEMLYQ